MGTHRSMAATANFNVRGAPVSGVVTQFVEGRSMKLQNLRGAKAKRTVRMEIVFNHLQNGIELPKAI